LYQTRTSCSIGALFKNSANYVKEGYVKTYHKLKHGNKDIVRERAG
jgi:hypothetical protein